MQDDQNGFQFQEVNREVSQLLDQYIRNSRIGKTPVLKQQTPETIAEKLKLESNFIKGFSSIEDIKSFILNYLDNTNHLRNPRYMGHQVAVPQDLSGIPDWIHGSINNPSSLYEMGPAGATLEAYMINWMLSQLGWFKGDNLYDFKLHENSGSGILTHGGSIANLSALSAARAAIAPEAWTEGSPKDLVVMGPRTSHYSIARAISIMGMGKNAFVPVPVDENEVLVTSALEEVYQEQIKQGKRVMAVVANACATSTGLFDDLEATADFCERHKLWYHVDGAHGAVALLSKTDKEKVRGIERADSLIWDAHKMMRVPALCTAVLYKNYNSQVNSFQQKGSYVFHEGDVIGMDSMPFTVECTKSALGTKLYWSFALEGEKAISNFVSNSFQMARELYHYLNNHPDFYCPYFPESNILCFQYRPDLISDQQQLELRYQLIETGDFYITSCEVDGKRFLRTVLMNPLSQEKDFIAMAEKIKTIAHRIIENSKE
ncbi:MAG: pyridoxal-dependent decarboxylase [Flavobacteriaceae bacterium]|nr:pyridoxal-dependent decarboxylase [Flavobacteriaceae bacterium]MDG1912838.1 pyridoxal-dependent decarboxylase [Flavobacteriaceae bacterium]